MIHPVAPSPQSCYYQVIRFIPLQSADGDDTSSEETGDEGGTTTTPPSPLKRRRRQAGVDTSSEVNETLFFVIS